MSGDFSLKDAPDSAGQGNVRELQNAIECALAMGEDETLGTGDPPWDVLNQSPGRTSRPAIERNASLLSLAEAERRQILDVLERVSEHHIRAATALGIARRTLYRRLK
jgi:transcriptional regulator with PAS, ATPase and Fis domain